MHGGAIGVIFDETTNCYDCHSMNIIVHTLEHVYYTTTALIGHKEAVNSLIVAKAVMGAWDQLGLLRDHVKVVMVDNALFVHCALCFFVYEKTIFPSG